MELFINKMTDEEFNKIMEEEPELNELLDWLCNTLMEVKLNEC